MSDLPFLDAYSGETLDELIAMESRYRVDSIVLATEQALSGKSDLTEAEATVLAVEALEREVNNGGYEQFFGNSSSQFVSLVVDALKRIGCPKTAALTQSAIDTLGIPVDPTPDVIEAALDTNDPTLSDTLEQCDRIYYEGAEEPIATKLFAYIKANRKSVVLGK